MCIPSILQFQFKERQNIVEMVIEFSKKIVRMHIFYYKHKIYLDANTSKLSIPLQVFQIIYDSHLMSVRFPTECQ